MWLWQQQQRLGSRPLSADGYVRCAGHEDCCERTQLSIVTRGDEADIYGDVSDPAGSAIPLLARVGHRCRVDRPSGGVNRTGSVWSGTCLERCEQRFVKEYFKVVRQWLLRGCVSGKRGVGEGKRRDHGRGDSERDVGGWWDKGDFK